MSGEMKFIQITSDSSVVDDRVHSNLYALDADGDVWQYDWAAHEWVQLKMERR